MPVIQRHGSVDLVNGEGGVGRTSLLARFASTHRIQRTWVQLTTGATCTVLDPVDARDPRIFVKVDPAVTSRPARVHEIYRLLAVASGRRLAPRPIGFDSSGIAYEWIDGEPIDAAVRRLVESPDGREELGAVAVAMGRALAELHERWTNAAPFDARDVPLAMSLRTRCCAWACGARSELRRSEPVRSPADLGPWNIVDTLDGAVFIDLDDEGPGVREIDVGRLAHRMRSLVDKFARRHPSQRRDRTALIERTVDALVEGYCSAAAEQGRPLVARRLVAAGSAAESFTELALQIRRFRRLADFAAAQRTLWWLFGDLVGAWRTLPSVERRRRAANEPTGPRDAPDETFDEKLGVRR